MRGFGAWIRRAVGGNHEAPPSPIPSPSRPPGPRSFAEGDNDFALALYGELRERAQNVFFSPFSVRTALGMAQAGARGETAVQMGEVLRASSSNGLHAAAAASIERLNAASGGEYEMAVANALWGQEGAPLLAEFLDLINRYYRGGLSLADFRREAERARVTINQWVEDRTRRKIRDLIPRGGLNAATRLVLVNAVYFKGKWVLRFPKDATRDERFHLDGGGTVRAPLMHQQERMWYLKATDYQAVELLYEGGDLSMLVLLPDRKDGLSDLEQGLSAEMLRDCVRRLALREVKLFLPRFKITWGTVDLSGPLAALGMALPFSPSEADFSGINDCRPPDVEALFISAVYHKAFVEANEQGTEAAATTAVATFATAARWPQVRVPIRIPVFRADHPFLFAIRDKRSGAILFLGRVADPTKE